MQLFARVRYAERLRRHRPRLLRHISSGSNTTSRSRRDAIRTTIRLRFDGDPRLAIDESHRRPAPARGRRRARAPARAGHPISRSTARAVAVESRYVIHADRTVGFAVGAYDRTRAAHDRSGPALLDGVRRHERRVDPRHRARSRRQHLRHRPHAGQRWAFPTTPGAFPDARSRATSDAFVSKFNPSGIGADLLDVPRRRPATRTTALRGEPVASRSTPPATPTSPARRTPPTFPSSGNAADSTYAAATWRIRPTRFYVKLGPTGALLYGTFIGGTDYEYTAGIAVDSARATSTSSGATASDAIDELPADAERLRRHARQDDVFLRSSIAAGRARLLDVPRRHRHARTTSSIAGGGSPSTNRAAPISPATPTRPTSRSSTATRRRSAAATLRRVPRGDRHDDRRRGRARLLDVSSAAPATIWPTHRLRRLASGRGRRRSRSGISRR